MLIYFIKLFDITLKLSNFQILYKCQIIEIPNKTLSNVFDNTMIHFEYDSPTLSLIVCSRDQ